MAIKVNQFSIKAKINDQKKRERYRDKTVIESGERKDAEMEEKLIQKCFDRVVEYLKSEKERF
jgi:hypothetical protein